MSVWPYLALWVLSLIEAFGLPTLEVIARLGQAAGAASLFADIIVFAFALCTCVHMLFVYLSYHEMEEHNRRWREVWPNWVGTKSEAAMRLVIFLMLLFIGGELCPLIGFLFGGDHVAYQSICRLPIDLKNVNGLAQTEKSIIASALAEIYHPENALLVTPVTIFGCFLTFLMLCVWDIWGYLRVLDHRYQGNTQRMKKMADDVFDVILRKWKRWFTSSLSVRRRFFISDALAAFFWLLLLIYMWGQRDGMINILLLFLFVFLILYAYMIYGRLGLWLSNEKAIINDAEAEKAAQAEAEKVPLT